MDERNGKTSARQHHRNGHDPSADEAWQPFVRAWRSVRTRLPQLERDLLRYATVQLDRGRLHVRRAVARAVLLAGAAIVALAVAVLAAVLLVLGLAGGLGELLGHVWLGRLLAGALLLCGLGATFAIARARGARRRLVRLQRKHARLAQAPEPRWPARRVEPQVPDL